MSKNINTSAKNGKASDESEAPHNDFHPPVQDERPVNIDGRPEDDFDDNDHSLFLTRPRRY